MTSVSKNVYIDKLVDIVNKYNNTYPSTIKMKPFDVKSSIYIGFNKENNKEDLKVGDHVRISRYKNTFKKGCTPNCSEEVFVIKKLKNTVLWTYVIRDRNGEEIVGTFYEKELQKTNQKEFRVEKVIKRRGDKLYVKRKGYDNSYNNWIDKKYIVQMSRYFPKMKPLGNVKVELDLSNYATKADLKSAKGADISKFAKKVDLASLKSEIDKLGIGKLETAPVDLSKLRHVVKNEVVKKIVYAIQTTDTSNLVKKTGYYAKLKLKRKYLIMIILNTLILKNLIS